MEEERVFAAVKQSLVTVMPDFNPESVSMEHSLADLGCNSIDRADVVAHTQELLAVTVPIREFQGVNNIRMLVELLMRQV